MSARNKITVGKPQYQIYEDLIVPPEALAPSGSIGFIIANDRTNGVWLSKGNGKWDQLNIIDVCGDIEIQANTTLYYSDTNVTSNTWTTMSTPTWVKIHAHNSTVVNNLIYPGVTGKYLVETTTQWYNGDAAVYWNIEAAVAKGGTVAGIRSFQSCTPLGNGFAATTTYDLIEIDAYNVDYVQPVFRYTNAPTGTGFNPRNATMKIKLIDRPLVLFECNFEDDNTDTPRITIVNDDTNAWYKGEPAAGLTAFSGSNCMYISNDGGTTWAYTNNVTQYSHFYFDIDIPNVPNSVWKARCQWIGTAESGYDEVTVYLAEQDYIPVAGSAPTGASVIGPLAGGADWEETYGLIEGAEGTSKRVIFTWDNDTSVGTEPIAIDNVAVYSYLDFENIWSLYFNEDWASGNFTANSWNVVNDGTSVNQWVVGTGTHLTDDYSAYITDNSAEDPEYDISDVTVGHFYKDFVIDSEYSLARLTFYWKCAGENGSLNTSYDYGLVHLIPTTTTPVAGTELLAATRVGASNNLGKHNLTSNWLKESIDLTDWIGDTVRVCFTWRNDSSVGTAPGFCVDDIRIEYK